MFVKDRNDVRNYFVKVRQKYDDKQALEPLEKLILDVILAHPEYHALLNQAGDSLRDDYSPEEGYTNPFLHMSMHIAIKEQIESDRPAGIRVLCEGLLDKFNDQHEVEHKVMECLGESLWIAQRNNSMPDEVAYLESIRVLR